MEVVGMFRVQGYEDCHNCLPRVGAFREEPVAANLTRECMIGLANPCRLYSVRRPIESKYRAVEDSCVLCESGDHKIGAHLCELLGRHARAEFCQDFEPYAEA